MNRESFVFYRSFYEAIQNIPKEKQGEIYNAICEYALFGTEPDESAGGFIKGMFTLMKENIDRAQSRYDSRVENGRKGGRPPKNKPSNNLEKPNHNLEKPSGNLTKPKQNLNVNVNVNDNVNENENINKNIKERDKGHFPAGYPIGENPGAPASTTSPKHKQAKTPETDEQFKQFWTAYPNKKSKATAYNAWKRLTPDAKLMEQMLKALDQQKLSRQWAEDGGRYIPYPATWLNGHRWEDVEAEQLTMPPAEARQKELEESKRRMYAMLEQRERRGEQT